MPVSSATGPSCHPYVPARWWWQRRRQKRDILAQVAQATPVMWGDNGATYSVAMPWGDVTIKHLMRWYLGFDVSGLPFPLSRDEAFALWCRLSNSEHKHHEQAGCLQYGPSCPGSAPFD